MDSVQNPAVRTACPPQRKLAAFNAGKLSLDDLEAIGEHLSDCARCLSSLSASRMPAPQPRPCGVLQKPVADPFCDDPDYLKMHNRIRGIFSSEQSKRSQANDSPIAGKTLPFNLAHYQIIVRIGSGAMGSVYRGVHLHLGTELAVKFLRSHHSGHSAAIARFRREMQAIGRLIHPNIVRATDAGEADGVQYLVMELLAGLDLSQVIRRIKPLPIADCCEMVRQAACGLQGAFENGLVHRDLKPSNLFLSDSGQVKILDLGLAVLTQPEDGSGELTLSGMLIGTADYMAPEQWRDCHNADIRADIYSLGCTLFKLLTGTPPFSGPDHVRPLQKMEAHEHVAPPAIRTLRPDVPPALAAIVQRMLKKKPAERFATPAEVMKALEPFCVGANLIALLQEANAKPEGKEVIDGATASTAKQHRSATSRQITVAPNRFRRIPTWTAVAAGLLGAIGLGTLLPWNYKFREETKPEISEKLREYPLYEWVDLLDRSPQVFSWWNGNSKSQWDYDSTQKTLTVTAFSTQLFSLGKAPSKDFKLVVGFEQATWTGGFGVFLGGKRDGPDGLQELTYQELIVRPAWGDKRSQFTLGHGGCTIRYGANGPGTMPLLNRQMLPFADITRPMGQDVMGRGETRLEVKVDSRDGIESVRWNDERFPSLTDKARKDRPMPNLEGEFGIICEGGNVVVRSAKLLRLP